MVFNLCRLLGDEKSLFELNRFVELRSRLTGGREIGESEWSGAGD
jgi:hypothetical protein